MQIIRKFNPDCVKLSSLYKSCLTVSIDESIDDYASEHDDGGESDEESRDSN